MTFEELANTLEKFGTVTVNDDNEEPRIIHFPSINFYGCAFNFENEGSAESRFYGGDDVYNPRKEV